MAEALAVVRAWQLDRLSDWDLAKATRRELDRRPGDPISWQASIDALLELADELRRRLPAEQAGHPQRTQTGVISGWAPLAEQPGPGRPAEPAQAPLSRPAVEQPADADPFLRAFFGRLASKVGDIHL